MKGRSIYSLIFTEDEKTKILESKDIAVDTLFILELVWYIISCFFSVLALLNTENISVLNYYALGIFLVPLLIKIAIKNDFYVKLKRNLHSSLKRKMIAIFRMMCLFSFILSILFLFDMNYNWLNSWLLIFLNVIVGATGMLDQLFWYLVSEKRISPISMKGDEKN